MTALLLLTLVLQGIPTLPGQGGTVIGVIQTTDGKPASRVRVVAMFPPDSPQDIVRASSLAALTETDDSGRFRLENVPPGRYLIAAGRIDGQTFFPGSLDAAKATPVGVSAGNPIAGINFTLNDSSGGRALDSFTASLGSATIELPFRIVGARIPVSFPGGFTRLVFSNVRDGRQLAAATTDRKSISVAAAQGSIVTTPESYNVSIENLPPGYSVKSITAGSSNLMQTPFQIPPALPMTIEFNYVPQPDPLKGVKVSGRYNGDIGPRSIYISNIQGTTFADGTFEFAGVPPGRHFITSRNNPAKGKSLGAAIIVGGNDLNGVAVEELGVLPMDISLLAQADSRPAGTAIAMPALSGRVVDETTGMGISEGIVYFSGQERLTFRLQMDGMFQIPHLLPGRYKIELQLFGRSMITRDVVIEEDDVTLEFRSPSLD